MRRIAAADYGEEIGAIRAVMGGDLSEMLFRQGLCCVAALSLWLATGREILLAWALGYGVLTLAYHWILRRPAEGGRLGRFLGLMAFHVVTSLWVTAMILYLLTWGGIAAVFLGACGVGGLALYALTKHDRWAAVAFVDVANVILAGVGTMAVIATMGLSRVEMLVVSLTGIGMIAYFLHSVADIIETRYRLVARHAAEAQAEKMQAIGQLGAGIAHDFNNILTVIRGNLDLIDFVEDTPQRQEFLEEARKGTDRAAHLVRQLLAYSRKSQLSVSTFCLRGFMDETVEVLRRVLPETIRIRVAPPVAEVALSADRALLNTAILNAALNARDAMMPGGGELTLSVRSSGAMAVVTICDTGPGVAPELLAKVTEPFFSTKPAGQGSGLGLSMIKGFAEQSGGEMRLANLPGGGFCVEIALPVAGAAEAAEACPAMAEVPRARLRDRLPARAS